jgi:hypothetical protein
MKKRKAIGYDGIPAKVWKMDRNMTFYSKCSMKLRMRKFFLLENCDYSANYKGKGRREPKNCTEILIFLICDKIFPVILAGRLSN